MSIAERVGNLVANADISARANEFAHMARYLVLGKGSAASALRYAQENRALPRIVTALKAASSVGTTTGGTWAAPLAGYDTLADAFVQSLRYVGVFDAMLPSMRAIPLHTRVVIVSVGATGATVGQGQMKPVSSLSLGASQLEEQKSVCIVVVTDELVKAANSNKLFATELSLAVASETDRSFLAKITTGITPVASGGITMAAITGDIGVALRAMDLQATSKVFLIVSPDIAVHWATVSAQAGSVAFPDMTINGGSIAGCTVLVSDAATVTGKIIAVDANQIAASGGTVELDASNQAAIQFETAPDSPPTAATVQQSFWQMNMTGLKATRWWGAERLRTGAVAVIDGVAGNSP